jgi:hypothetical protein
MTTPWDNSIQCSPETPLPQCLPIIVFRDHRTIKHRFSCCTHTINCYTTPEDKISTYTYLKNVCTPKGQIIPVFKETTNMEELDFQ